MRSTDVPHSRGEISHLDAIGRLVDVGRAVLWIAIVGAFETCDILLFFCCYVGDREDLV